MKNPFDYTEYEFKHMPPKDQLLVLAWAMGLAARELALCVYWWCALQVARAFTWLLLALFDGGNDGTRRG